MVGYTVFFIVSTQLVGISAGVLTSVSMLPQLVKIIREKEVDELSVAWLLILFVGLSLWAYYGWLKEDWPIIITNTFSLLVNLTLIILRYRFRKK